MQRSPATEILQSAASMYAKWAYGFWQCKEHYHTQQELTDAAHKFRELAIPVDNFVQDWHYWGNEGWGPHWDPSIYPAPGDMVKNLSSINIQLMVSVCQSLTKRPHSLKICLRKDT